MLQTIGTTDYSCYSAIGKRFPNFHYKDVNGNIYDSANTKGKIVVLKAWSISCVPCVAEMPLLNQVKKEYHDRTDVLFLSIAYDSKTELLKFKKRIQFDYAIIPVTVKYIQQDLHAAAYPCHWVINKQGIVANMSYDKNDMIAALRVEAMKK